MMKKLACAFTFLTLTLPGCGGGGSSNSVDNTSTPALSETQKNYESMALSTNGGMHYLSGNLVFSTAPISALPVLPTGLHTVTTPAPVAGPGPTVLSPSSFFVTYDSSIPQTAISAPQPISETYTSIASRLAIPALSEGNRYLLNGVVYTAASPTQAIVSYTGSNVLNSILATDGKTVVHSLLGISYTPVGLSGLIANSPTELFTNSSLGIITNTINGMSLYNKQTSWQSGSAYLKVVRQTVGDTVTAGDCLNPITVGSNVTPCSTTISTLEGFFPHTSTSDGVTYQIGDGQIVTLAGVRAWVASKPLGASAVQYRIYYQSNSNIYRAVLTRDGAPLQQQYGGQAPQNFYIFLNSAALQSIKAAINF